jgi:hypothetical protein
MTNLKNIDLWDVTRVEVIDNNGRSYTKNWVDKVEMQLQDDGKTLKLFVHYDDEEISDD